MLGPQAVTRDDLTGSSNGQLETKTQLISRIQIYPAFLATSRSRSPSASSTSEPSAKQVPWPQGSQLGGKQGHLS